MTHSRYILALQREIYVERDARGDVTRHIFMNFGHLARGTKGMYPFIPKGVSAEDMSLADFGFLWSQADRPDPLADERPTNRG